jgi:hypothetical protein
MFRAPRAHHQERQIVPVQSLVTVTLCWWPCRVQVRSLQENYKYKLCFFHQNFQQGHQIVI